MWLDRPWAGDAEELSQMRVYLLEHCGGGKRGDNDMNLNDESLLDQAAAGGDGNGSGGGGLT